MFLNPRSRFLLTKFSRPAAHFCSPITMPYEEFTFALIKPDGFHKMGGILDAIHKEGFNIRKLRMTQFSNATSKVFYEEHIGKHFFEILREFVTSGPCIGLKLGRHNAIQHWRDTMGPTDSEVARVEAPESIRARFGTDGRLNAVHGSDSLAASIREKGFFFGLNSLMKR